MNAALLEHTSLDPCLHCQIGEWIEMFYLRSTESSEDKFGKILVLLAISLGDHLGEWVEADSLEGSVTEISKLVLERALLIAKGDTH